jgi:hypothetical protein
MMPLCFDGSAFLSGTQATSPQRMSHITPPTKVRAKAKVRRKKLEEMILKTISAGINNPAATMTLLTRRSLRMLRFMFLKSRGNDIGWIYSLVLLRERAVIVNPLL